MRPASAAFGPYRHLAQMTEPALSCKAWRFHSNGLITDSLRLDDVPIPSRPSHVSRLLDTVLGSYGPHPGILIQVAAVSLNPVDYKMIQPGGATFLVRKPGVPCSDFSGVIVAWLGNSKRDQWSQKLGLKIGDKVYGHLSTEWRMLLVGILFSLLS
jgi:NADPH:quinone reductase-like Zn-dependent oxidoreductase